MTITSILKNKWILLSMVLACWALIASFLGAYYWLQYWDIHDRIAGAVISVNLGIDYGNSPRVWRNNTKALTGQTLFDVTKQNANVTYRTTLSGTEILSIDGVAKEDPFGWTYWVWNGTSHLWSIVWEGADTYKVADQETFMWYYQNTFNPPQ